MKKVAIFIVLFIALIGIVIGLKKSSSSTENTPDRVAHTSSYTSKEYGYSFSYPGIFQIKEYIPENVVIGYVSEAEVDGVAEVHVLSVEGEAGKTFQEVVATQLMSMCAADGPTTSFSCTKVATSKPFTTDDGVEGSEIYLVGELTNLQTRESSEIQKGPYYVISLQTSATNSRVLVVQPPLNKSAEEADKETVTSVAKSIKIEQ